MIKPINQLSQIPADLQAYLRAGLSVCGGLAEGHAGTPGPVGQPAAYGLIHPPRPEDTQSCRSLRPPPAARRHFGRLEWKRSHNGRRGLKSCGSNIGSSERPPRACVHVCALRERFTLRHKSRESFSFEGWEVVHIMFDRIRASKHSLTDKGNNYLSFKCLKILRSPLLLLLNMLLR